MTQWVPLEAEHGGLADGRTSAPRKGRCAFCWRARQPRACRSGKTECGSVRPIGTVSTTNGGGAKLPTQAKPGGASSVGTLSHSGNASARSQMFYRDAKNQHEHPHVTNATDAGDWRDGQLAAYFTKVSTPGPAHRPATGSGSVGGRIEGGFVMRWFWRRSVAPSASANDVATHAVVHAEGGRAAAVISA